MLTTETTDADLVPGSVVGAYVIGVELGRGAMGTVYRAHDAALDRDVAIKVMSRIDDAGFTERMKREARIMARLEHPHVVGVYAAGTHNGRVYLVLQLVEGESLGARLVREGALPVAEALRIAREAAQALEAASEAGIVHRDIKPDNLLLDARQRVKVSDFGLSRDVNAKVSLSGSSDFVGTPCYSSPEQWYNQPLDVRSDIYALGVCLHEMLAGRPPFEASSLAELLQQILGGERAPLVDVPNSVVRLVEKMMATAREDRFATAAELVSAIDRADSDTRTSPAWGEDTRERAMPVPVATQSAFLVEVAVEEGPSAGEVFLLERFPAHIGRGQDADVQLRDDPADPKLSRRHACLTVQAGRIVISDASTNGTWVGERCLSNGESVTLQGDEEVWLGPRTRIALRLRGGLPRQPERLP